MKHEFPFGTFRPENRTTFSDVPSLPEIFDCNDPKRRFPFTFQPDFPELFVKDKLPFSSGLACAYRPRIRWKRHRKCSAGSSLINYHLSAGTFRTRQTPHGVYESVVMQSVYRLSVVSFRLISIDAF